MMTGTKYCPTCEEDTLFEFESQEQTYSVRNDSIALTVPLWTCHDCKETIVDETYGDPIEHAFDAYRTNHGLLQPKEIQAIREKWRLSQAALAALLGMSQATINRYEQGSIQQEKEDELIRVCNKPEHMKDLLKRRGDVLTHYQFRIAREAVDGAKPAFDWLLEHSMPAEISIRSGFRAFDYDRYTAVIVWICSNVAVVTQTKLYKLLFYIDALAFKMNARSITGTLYRRIQYGPVPSTFGELRSRLEQDEYIAVQEKEFQNGNTGEVFLCGANANMIDCKFDTNELHVLRCVCDKLGNLTPSALCELSHQETAWKDTPPKEIISYEKAMALSLSITE